MNIITASIIVLSKEKNVSSFEVVVVINDCKYSESNYTVCSNNCNTDHWDNSKRKIKVPIRKIN